MLIIIRAIRVVYFSPRITLISRMLQCFKIRVIRAIRVVYLSPRITRISRMQLFFKIRVIRAIRVVYLFTTNFSNLTNVAVL